MRLWVPHQGSHPVQHRGPLEVKGVEWVGGGGYGCEIEPQGSLSKNSYCKGLEEGTRTDTCVTRPEVSLWLQSCGAELEWLGLACPSVCTQGLSGLLRVSFPCGLA